MVTINKTAIQKKINDAIRSKIKKFLTPEEFGQVQFMETSGKLNWNTTKEIGEKIVDRLKTDT